MSVKLQAAMTSGLGGDETKPRRFDLTMSRRTRRPAAAATSATSCHEQDHHQSVDVEGLGLFHQPEQQDPGLFCLSDHLQSRQPELDAHNQEHETSQQCSEDTTLEQASLPQTCRLVEKDDESKAQQQPEDCQEDNSRRFSLQELIEDEDEADAATEGTEENAAAVRGVAEGAVEKRPERQVSGRRVIGMMRRYVKVRSVNPKRASPEKNAAPVC